MLAKVILNVIIVIHKVKIYLNCETKRAYPHNWFKGDKRWEEL